MFNVISTDDIAKVDIKKDQFIIDDNGNMFFDKDDNTRLSAKPIIISEEKPENLPPGTFWLKQEPLMKPNVEVIP